MTEQIDHRVCREARYIIDRSATVRNTAAHFHVSKSTVHKDLTHRLAKVDAQLYEKVRCVLDVNKAERHLRGGEATMRKFREMDKISTK